MLAEPTGYGCEKVVPRKGLEPPLSYREADFKSAASTIPPPGHFTFQLLKAEHIL
ncbi:uncharacterized protein METZ01_LOCUS436846 [marine metagenome]|uniref:Uncharacterized protein n=1 Tax=marine metagenome TaxID=408172 RepID=A0A382YL34_9ZZZZ